MADLPPKGPQTGLAPGGAAINYDDNDGNDDNDDDDDEDDDNDDDKNYGNGFFFFINIFFVRI